MVLVGSGIGVILLVAIAVEVLWSRRHCSGAYNVRESLGNGVMAVGNALQKPLTIAWSAIVLSLAEPLQILALPNTPWILLLTFVVTDFVYYWYHRWSHQVGWLWAMHQTHHSSPWMNLTTALRLNWVAKFVSPFFFVPLIIVGFSPAVVPLCLTLGLLYQFWLHTRAIGKLGWLEGRLFNTPSAHRVHHGSNPRYIDKNFAGVFIVWDRVFGTYEPESESVEFGITTGFVGHNPFVIQFLPIWRFFRGTARLEKQTPGQVVAAHRPVADRVA